MTTESNECRGIWNFFGRRSDGAFVEVGANHPTQFSQTWFLEQQGWSGVLIEPNPQFQDLLREQRPRSKTFQVAVGNPSQTGEVDLFLSGKNLALRSALAPPPKKSSAKTIRVQLRTLDSVLVEAGVTRVDFISIDVEGFELDVLQGFDLERFRPQLILLEEHRGDFKKHFYLRRHGYRLVKRTGLNNWYVPAESSATVCGMNSFAEMFYMWRKMWLNGPLNVAYRRVKRIFRPTSHQQS
jgi:FkbM family methyltransferase